MKRSIFILAAALAASVSMASASVASAEYTTYVGCGVTDVTPPADTCEVGDEIGAFFESSDTEVEYEVCVEFPDGEYRCANEEAEAGVLYVNEITSEFPGVHFVEWFVGPNLVGFAALDLDEPVPPAPPAPLPPAVLPPAPAPTPIGPSPACKQVTQRLKTLKAKLQNTEGAKAKGKVRPKVKAAKAKKKRLC